MWNVIAGRLRIRHPLVREFASSGDKILHRAVRWGRGRLDRQDPLQVKLIKCISAMYDAHSRHLFLMPISISRAIYYESTLKILQKILKIMRGLRVRWLFVRWYADDNAFLCGLAHHRMPLVNNNMYLELAKLDYNDCQACHHSEWDSIRR